MEAFAGLYAALEAFPLPVVCVCVGDVVGAGTELAMGSDLRVAGDNLKLQWVGGKLGVPVGPARLVALVGEALAKDLIFTARRLGSDEALSMGLVNRAVPASAAEAEAVALAQEIGARDPGGLRRMKALFRDMDATAARVAHENGVLVDWQRHGAGLPQRGSD
jgi:enoyl-CoA hydratase/carnithine racemase